MEEEIVGIEENDYGQYHAECPYCGHIIDIDDDLQGFGTEDAIKNDEIVEIYCDECESYFDGQLS